jgi:hypothetical protein
MFYSTARKLPSLLQRWRCRCKFRSRRIASRNQNSCVKNFIEWNKRQILDSKKSFIQFQMLCKRSRCPLISWISPNSWQLTVILVALVSLLLFRLLLAFLLLVRVSLGRILWNRFGQNLRMQINFVKFKFVKCFFNTIKSKIIVRNDHSNLHLLLPGGKCPKILGWKFVQNVFGRNEVL